MARQIGIIKLKGTLDDITFYKTEDGHLAKTKSGVSADRIASDPNFQRTRENGEEFKKAGKGGKLIRAALNAYLQTSGDSKLPSRLVRAMMKVIKADQTSTRGQRNVIDGEAMLLEGFDFNRNGTLKSNLFIQPAYTIDRPTGKLTVNAPAFIPLNMISAPVGATHFKLVSAGLEVDFENEVYVVDTHETAVFRWDRNPTAAINMVNQVTAASTHPLFLVLGVAYYQEVNGAQYELKTGIYNALAIVKVDA
ncbi:MAG: hypothetical protein JST39_13045 [Bacteroidetes bacterium]|nr:hypothetical protein [Bacteroidota bacterium]